MIMKFKFVDYAVTAEHKMIQDAVHKFLAGKLAPIIQDLEEREEMPLEIIKEMGQLGFLALMAPEEYGGGGHDVIGQAIVSEEIAKICGGTCTSVNGHVFSMHWLDKFGTKEQRDKYVAMMASGEYIGCIGITEPGAGSDVAGLELKAVQDGDHYVLNGTKTFITNGSVADIMVVMARTGGPGAKGISNFIIETKTPGYEASKPFRKLGNCTSPTCEIAFTDCRIPAENLLGTLNRGFIETMNFFPFERVLVAVQCGALAEASFYEALRYAQERSQFGQAIIRFQMVQQMIADMAVDIQSIKAMAKDCLQQYAGGIEANTEASMAKLYATEAVMRVTSNAIQILGGYGYTREYPVERLFRDARCYAIGGGTSQIQRQIIARAMMTG
jgi:alkylation response protein AidB-like acyl-CoA dehydrogenase